MQSFDFVCSIWNLQCIRKFENCTGFDLVCSSICQTNNFLIGNGTGTLFSLVHVWVSGIHNRTSCLQRCLDTLRWRESQPHNFYDKYAVKVVKNTETIGHVRRAISPYITYILAKVKKSQSKWLAADKIEEEMDWKSQNYTKLKAYM